MDVVQNGGNYGTCMKISQFIIRVYGIWINVDDQVLLSDELYEGMAMTKFPGGGMELGEGPIACLKREWLEELGVEIEVLNHFYTTDFFQQSAFHADAQIMSIYYRIIPKSEVILDLTTVSKEGEEAFRMVHISELTEDMVTFPIDKKVVELLKQE